ncbi:MAG: hypothetical protein QM778_17565 [Myxococcales bacterium]
MATIASVVVGRTSITGALRTAAFWGLGHTLTFLAVGLAMVRFELRMPHEFEVGVEALVALSLLFLGLLQLLPSAREPSLETAPHPARPVALGCIHGLAGSAAVALLALTTIGSALHALLYLALFGLGTVLGMIVITLALAYLFRASSARVVRRRLVVSAGLVSTLCGARMLVGLLSATE